MMQGLLCGRSGARGFTLLEMMVTSIIVVILAAMAITSWDMIQRNRIVSGTGEVASALGLARSEAILRQLPVALCAENGELTDGWRIVVNNPDCAVAGGALSGDVLFAREEPLKSVSLCTTGCSVVTPDKFVFGPLGNLVGGPATAVLCVAGNMKVGREIVVNVAGLVKTSSYDCP
ncbi:MAG: GspH/FimT family pseudopilin [Zoogloeaceae bacterium]|nr:GspH/FimT family pseudopilin [Zoogloeaceae bacterium]